MKNEKSLINQQMKLKLSNKWFISLIHLILVSTTIQENHLLVVDLDEKIGWHILYRMTYDSHKCFVNCKLTICVKRFLHHPWVLRFIDNCSNIL